MVSLIVPRLTAPDNSSLQTSISTGLTSVPEAVALQYPTVDAIYQALVQAAQASNTSLKQNDGSVLLDVTLQVRGDDGTLTTVAPENFPAEGVEVLLPYPQGTNRSCTFVITHMITSGERAGQIETLKGTRGPRTASLSGSPACPPCASPTKSIPLPAQTAPPRWTPQWACPPPGQRTAAAWHCGAQPACAAPPCSSP